MLKTGVAIALAAALFALPALAARTCYEPQRPDLGGEKLRALGKRAAYASFLSDECGFASDIHKKYANLLKSLYPDNTSGQQQYLDDFRSKKRTFAQDANFLAVKKRCLIDTGKTRAFVNEASDDVTSFADSAASSVREFEKKRSEYGECQARRESELVSERQVEAQAEYERSEDSARKKAVQDLEKGFRESLLDSKKGTYVLRLRNPSNRTAEFQLKCCVADGNRCKTFNMVIPTNDSTELGFMEGWPGNFVSGERCYAYYRGQEIWWYGLR